MWEWFKKRFESILDNIIFAVVVAVGLAIWNIIKELSWPWIIGISIGVFLIIIALIRLIVFLIKKSEKEKAKAKNKSENLDKNLTINYEPMDKYIRVHTCSQCGWGYKVFSKMLENRTIKCPKCGNVEVNDNI